MEVWEWADKSHILKKRDERIGIHEGRLADDEIKFCDKCNTCWEPDKYYSRNSNQNVVLYYKDFPRYGKEIQTCQRCGGDK